MAGATMLGSPAWIEAFIAATVYREQKRDLADAQWLEEKRKERAVRQRTATVPPGGHPETMGPSTLAVAS